MASSEALTRAPKRARSQISSTLNRSPSPQQKRHEPSIYYGEPISTTPCDDNESSKQELCEQCNLIDLDYVFTLPSKFRNESGVPIVKLNNTGESIRCPLCCLFAAVKYPRWEGCQETHGYHLRALDSFSAMGIANCKKNLAAEPFTLLAAFPGKLSKRPERWAAARSGYTGLLPLQAVISSLETNAVSWSNLQLTTKCCHVRSKFVEDVMGVPARAVVPRRMNEYLALSYVWGHVKQSPLPLVAGESNTNSSSDIFPRTIEDAMIVVRRLGYRYLWVDRYCINQNNAAEKHSQIRDMGRIYANAVATIVAVSGNDSEAGLPGVTIVQRTEQPSVMIKGRLLISTLPHLTYFLDRSAWASRGWTYQEAMLSRRCLFFTEAQAYFVCKSMTRSESLRDSLRFGSSKRIEPLYSLGPAILSFAAYRHYDNLARGVKQTVFTAHLNEYTERSLTYDADAISAFRGIMGNLAIDDYLGIPIFAESGNQRKLSFLVGLFWSPKEGSSTMTVRRRLQFPSWTWANLTIRVGYDLILQHHELRQMLLEDSITGHEKPFDLGTEVEIRLSSGIHLPVQDLSLSTAFSEVEAPSSLFIEAKVLEIRTILEESWNELGLCVILQNSYDESDGIWGEIFLDEIVGGIRVPADVRGSLETLRWWAFGLFGCRYTPISVEESAKIFFLVVEKSEGVTKRIGVGWMDGMDYHRIPKTRTRFELK